jgi:dynein assembly factor 1
MEEFPDLRSLFLECNCLETMEGLSENRELRCLFFQQNMLEEIDHLEELQELTTLNVSHNQISKLENLSCLPKLETLQASHNKLVTARSISHLRECPGLTVVDLAHNELEEEEVLEVLQGMPNLACLYLQGNPVVTKKRYYRKTMIARIPTLKYLDDRPVFPLERQCAEAWSREGLEGERAARAQFKEEEAERDRANYEYMKKIREEGWAKRRAAAGLPPTEGDPFFDNLGDGEWEVPQEPPELVAARERLAAFAAQAGEEEPPELTAQRTALAAGGAAIQESRAPPGKKASSLSSTPAHPSSQRRRPRASRTRG